MNYIAHLLVLVSIYIILASSLNLLAGYSGLLSFCHAGFFGIGAYITAQLLVQAHWSFSLALVAAVGFTAVLAWLSGRECLRLRGDHFVLATIALQIGIAAVLHNWDAATGGALGIPGVPRPSIRSVELRSSGQFLVPASACAIAVLVGIWLLVRSPFGLTLQAARDDELAALSLGKNVRGARTVAFVVSGSIAALAGGLLASYLRFVDPTSFTLDTSILLIAIVVIGGAGSLAGPVVGALLMVGVPEALQFLRLPDTAAANLREVLFGCLLLLLMRARPVGLVGRYDFD
jgi:branched-chain amino acid transport system permease protein